MTKLFITLYLVVLASFGFVNSIDTLVNNLPSMERANDKIFKGSFLLLERSIQGLNQAQIEATVEQHKKAFDPYLDLFELSDLLLSDDEIADLKQGKIVSSEEENDAVSKEIIKVTGSRPIGLDFMYKKMPNTTQVWRLNFDVEANTSINNLDISVEIFPGKFVSGMHYLIHSTLLKEPQQKWPQLINELKPDYGLLLSLHDEPTVLASLKVTPPTAVTIRLFALITVAPV